MIDETTSARLDQIEGRLNALELMLETVVRLLSATRPLANVLERYEATESQEQALYKLLDSYATRITGHQREHPTFSHWEQCIAEIFPQHRGNREFSQMIIDTLKVERPAYRRIHDYMVRNHWPMA
jgi:hypothetical protein